MSRPMSEAQRIVLRQFGSGKLMSGYCDLMLVTGLTSYTAIDLVFNALERRGFITHDYFGDRCLTDAGRLALEAIKEKKA
jgi:hypothetical protein